MIGPKHDDGANDGNQHAVEVEAGDPRRAYGCEQEAADHRADDPEHQVKQQSLTERVRMLLATKPAISPKTIQARTDISLIHQCA